MVIMDSWVLPHRGGLRDDLFIKHRHQQMVENTEDEGLFPHQRFVRTVMDPNSPYRGLVVFHGLGVGKTCTSIATAAAAAPSVRRIIVFTRASLRAAYLREFNSCGTISAHNPGLSDRFTFYAYNSSSGKEHDELVNAIHTDRGFFDNTLVIVDEAHRFIARALSGAASAYGASPISTGSGDRSIAYLAYMALFRAGDAVKLLLLSGTPIINTPFECATLLNLARGHKPIYRVYMTNSLSPDKIMKIANHLEYTDPYVESASIISINGVEDDGISTSMHAIDVTLVPHGFMKLTDHPHRVIRVNQENVISMINRTSHVKERSSILAALNGQRVEVLSMPLFPDNPSIFDEMFIDAGQSRMLRRDIFMRRASGLLSYFNTRDEAIYPAFEGLRTVVVDMSPWQYEAYDIIRSREIRKEQRRSQVESPSATYKAASRAVCNFAFPPTVIRTSTSSAIGTSSASSVTSTINQLIAGGFLSPDKLSDFSPKMHRIIETVRTSHGIDLVYSQFRTLEGIGILTASMREYGMSEISIARQKREFVLQRSNPTSSHSFVVLGDDDEINDMLINLLNSRFGLLPPRIQSDLGNMFPGVVDNTTGSIIKCILITESGSEGISLKCCRRVHILEPYWNNVRIDQVIGRAVRAHSHDALPAEQRNVEAFLYMASIPVIHRETNFTIRWYDKGRSSDVIIRDIAERKQALIDDFSAAMRGSAIDCGIWDPDPHQITCVHDQSFMYHPSSSNTIINEFQQEEENSSTQQSITFSRKIHADGGKIVLLQIDGTNDLVDEDIFLNTGRVVIIAHLTESGTGIVMLPQNEISSLETSSS